MGMPAFYFSLVQAYKKRKKKTTKKTKKMTTKMKKKHLKCLGGMIFVKKKARLEQ